MKPLAQVKIYTGISGNIKPGNAPDYESVKEDGQRSPEDIIDIINQMIQLDDPKQGGTGEVKTQLVEALKGLDAVKEFIENQPAKWWQYDRKNLTSINAINKVSREMDTKYSIRRTIVAMPAADIVTLIQQLNAIEEKKAAQAEFDAAEGEVGDPAADFAASGRTEESYKPIGDILEEAFGVGGKSGPMDADTVKKFTDDLKKMVKETPPYRAAKVNAILVLVIGGAVKHKAFEEEIYPHVKDMPWVKELAEKWWKSKGKFTNVKKRADEKEAADKAAADKAAADKDAADYGANLQDLSNQGLYNASTKLGNLGDILREELAKRDKSE